MNPAIKYMVSFLVFFSVQQLRADEDFCISCHRDLDDKPSQLYMQDIHYKSGLSCASCHGGNKNTDDMDAAMSKSAGFLGVPSGDRISLVCAGCHSDKDKMRSFGSEIKTGQYENLKNSVHYRMAVNGKERIIQCTTCHNAHGIRKVKDISSPVYPVNIPFTCSKCHGSADYMKIYNSSLPVDQLTKYRTSVHGELNKKGNVKAAECVSCHGSHNILSSKDVRSMVYKLNIPGTCSSCHSDVEYMKEFKIPVDQLDKYKRSAHGIAIFEKQDLSAPVCNDCHGNHGAVPPGISSISNVCGSCHVLNAQLFSGSPHKAAFDREKFPECETCHGSHEILTARDQLLGIKKGAVCLKCHTQNKNREGYLAADHMSRYTDTLLLLQSKAGELIFQAEQKGMEVEEAKYMLREVHQARLEARTIVHSFNEDKFREVTGKGIKTAGYIIQDAQGAIDEFYFRRYGLAAAIVIISFLIVIIYLYLKRIEKSQNTLKLNGE